MKNILLYTFILLNITACSQNNLIIKYKAFFPSESKNVKKNYYINVPTGGELSKERTLTDKYYTEYRIVYPDSSIIYITNDNWNGSLLNVKNRIEAGIGSYYKEHLLDTISNEGLQNNDLYWREVIQGEIVVGYVNCPSEKKKIFDEAIESIRKKRKLN